MAQSTAYYEGLQYGENKIPDFGGAAIKGVDRMIQLQEDERRRKEKELQFRMKMIQDNPEVAYASFENSGIKNIDTYNTKVAELVKNKFNDLNLKYQEDGDKTAYVMGVSKLKGEVMNYTTHVKPMIEYGQKITELGENASAVMYDNVERIDGAMQYGVPSMSPDGTLSNVSVVPQDDGSFKQDKIAFGEMQALTNIHQRQDKFGLATDAVKSFGQDSRFIDKEGNVVLSTLLTREGNLNPSASKIIKADVSSLGRSSLVDIADQFGIQAQYGSNGELLNRKELVDGVADAEIEYAASLMQERQTEDEVEKTKIDIALRDSYLRQKRMNKSERDAKRYNYSYYTEENAQREGIGLSGAVEEFTATKEIKVSEMPLKELKLEGPVSAEAAQNGVVQQIHRNNKGEMMVTIRYTQTVPGTGVNLGQTYKVPQMQRLRLETRAQKNFFLSRLDPGLGVISDPVPKPGEQKVDKNDPLGLNL
jgi:hypothetical protein